MRFAASSILAISSLAWAVGCATGAHNWVRADGSPGDEAQLKRDRMSCFPTTAATGPGSAGVADAEDCMRNRGWRKPGT